MYYQFKMSIAKLFIFGFRRLVEEVAEKCTNNTATSIRTVNTHCNSILPKNKEIIKFQLQRGIVEFFIRFERSKGAYF